MYHRLAKLEGFCNALQQSLAKLTDESNARLGHAGETETRLQGRINAVNTRVDVMNAARCGDLESDGSAKARVASMNRHVDKLTNALEDARARLAEIKQVVSRA
jgi:hypothetical protein